jgi:DNA-binding response OmpR family regulator
MSDSARAAAHSQSSNRSSDPEAPACLVPVTTALRLDVAGQRLVGQGHGERLTSREFRLLCYFLRHPGVVLSRGQLLDAVWGGEADIADRGVDHYVHFLRRKLKRGQGPPRYLVTRRGEGYEYRGPSGEE